MYLLDQSLSIPPEQREAMLKYVNAAVRQHREKDDRVGVIVFGRDAAIEVPPFDDDVQMAKIETTVNPEYTNLAAAMKLAQATFPEDAAKRVVVVSDGNQNLGNALEQAQGLAAAGIGIDVLPIRYHNLAEVAVERVALPGDVRRGQPFDLRVVVNNLTEPGPGRGPGRRLRRGPRKTGHPSIHARGNHRCWAKQRITLPPGKKVFSIRQQIDAPNFYTYEARFIPDRPEDDTFPQNNRATAFTQVQGKGQVLLDRGLRAQGRARPAGRAPAAAGAASDGARRATQPFDSLADLQPFDAVVLANVPRSTNEESTSPTSRSTCWCATRSRWAPGW